MRIISRKQLREFGTKHPDCKSALDAWYKVIKQSNMPNFSALRRVFPSADKVRDLTLFNIGGNKVRLVAAIHFNTQIVYIRHVLTHAEYNKNKWKQSL